MPAKLVPAKAGSGNPGLFRSPLSGYPRGWLRVFPQPLINHLEMNLGANWHQISEILPNLPLAKGGKGGFLGQHVILVPARPG
jgi:hypothetical protein